MVGVLISMHHTRQRGETAAFVLHAHRANTVVMLRKHVKTSNAVMCCAAYLDAGGHSRRLDHNASRVHAAVSQWHRRACS
jgi:hypothetical protein